MLVEAPPTGSDLDPDALNATAWLGDRYAFTQITSLQDFVLGRQIASNKARSVSKASFIGYGDPMLTGGDLPLSATATSAAVPLQQRADGEGYLADPAKLRELARLPGTAKEILDIGAAFAAPPSAIRLGASATEANVRAADLSHADVIAFATHGLLAGEIGGINQPALVFTPPVVPSETDDGLLTAVEITHLKLDADWVILSACNTAGGDGKGENAGLSGLARAFFYAGARSLLVTHWPVRDDVASELTVATVRGQRDLGLSPGLALQAAIAEVRRSTDDSSRAHPSAWAPFVLVGSGIK